MIGEVVYHPDMRPVVQRVPQYWNATGMLLDQALQTRASNFNGKPYLLMGEPLLQEPAIYAPTHRANEDSVLMTSVARYELAGRRLAYLAKEEIWTAGFRKAEDLRATSSSPIDRIKAVLFEKLDIVAKYLVEPGGGFPVDRENPDLEEVLAWAETALEEELSLLIYPEGERITEKKGYEDITKVQAMHRGAALIAVLFGVPVQPIAIWGTQNLTFNPMEPKQPIIVNAGKPINPSAPEYNTEKLRSPERKAVKITADLRGNMQSLLDEARVRHDQVMVELGKVVMHASDSGLIIPNVPTFYTAADFEARYDELRAQEENASA